jgi:hypothetical protein
MPNGIVPERSSSMAFGGHRACSSRRDRGGCHPMLPSGPRAPRPCPPPRPDLVPTRIRPPVFVPGASEPVPSRRSDVEMSSVLPW